MALIHNIILRGLNSIYNQCASPKLKFSEDIADFMLFCASFSIVLRSHHATEENVYFPLLDSMCSLSRKGVATQNHNEHETFLPGLAAFDAYVEKFKDGEGEAGAVGYDGNDLKKIIGIYSPASSSHISRTHFGLRGRNYADLGDER
jgi:hemerythrin-like domain-containing protein